MLCKEEKSHKYKFWHLASCYISRIWIREGFPSTRTKKKLFFYKKITFWWILFNFSKAEILFPRCLLALLSLMINLIRSSSRNFSSSSVFQGCLRWMAWAKQNRQTDGSRTIKPWSKNMINFFSFSSQITGAAQIIIGTSLLWGHVGYYGIVQNKLWAPPAILLALGPFTFILCWMGCQATNQKKRCLLGLVSGFKDIY